MSWVSVKRAVRWYLRSVGEYSPETWLAHERQRKAEARKWFLERMAERDLQEKNANQEIKQARAELASERATQDCTSPPPPQKTRTGRHAEESYNAS